jgi:hypothetical protein
MMLGMKEGTGYTPFFLNYGQHPYTPIAMQVPQAVHATMSNRLVEQPAGKFAKKSYPNGAIEAESLRQHPSA